MHHENTKPALRELILWVTTDCNLRCSYCYASGGDSQSYMDWNTARAAIDIMNHFSEDYTIQFAGGEPLLHFELIKQVAAYTSKKKVLYQLQTNGTLIDINIAAELKRIGIAVGVSLDGIPEVNDRLRRYPDGQGSSFDVIRGIQNLCMAGIRTGCTCVVSAENVEYLSDLVTLLSYLGNVEGISLDFLRQAGRAAGQRVLPANPDTASRSIRAALETADIITVMGGQPVKFREVERLRYILNTGKSRENRCYFDACQSLMVKPDGEAYPCASLAEYPEFKLGNVHEITFTDNLEERIRKTRNLYRSPLSCIRCPEFRLCGGPCPAQVYTSVPMGSSDEPPECSLRREMVKYARDSRLAVRSVRT